MGVVFMPVALAAFILWGFAVWLLARPIAAKVKNVTNNKFLHLLTYLLIFISVWLIQNFEPIHYQIKINPALSECGWKVNRTIKNVKGIYVQDLTGGLLPAPRFLQSIYPEIEFASKDGLVTEHFKNGTFTQLPHERTLPYGIIYKQENIDNGLLRISYNFLNFDTGETLAKKVYFNPQSYKGNENVWKEIALLFLKYQYSLCGDESNWRYDEQNYKNIFTPEYKNQ